MSPIKNTLTLHAPSDPERLLRAAMADALRGVIHALRGPLANLLILYELAETLRRSPPGPYGGSEALMRRMIGQIRTEGDALGYDEALLDVADVIAAAARLCRPLAASRGVAVVREHIAPFCILGDSVLLTQALDAMLGAAIAGSARGSEVRVAFERREAVAAVIVSYPATGGTPAPADAAAARTARQMWLARLIAVRHGGGLETGVSQDGSRLLTLFIPASVR